MDQNTSTSREVDQIFDEMLVLQAQAGRRDALERLAARWRPRHYSHARRLLGSHDRAADAVQDAWMSIVRGIWQLNDPGRFSAWAYAVLTRRCQDMYRRLARESGTALDEVRAEDQAASTADALDLHAGLVTLPREQQATVALFYKDGLSVTEIAKILEIPTGTVKTRLFHARRALRRYLCGDES